MVENDFEAEEGDAGLSPEEQDWLTQEAILASQEADEHPELLLTLDQAFAFLHEDEHGRERVKDAA